MSDAPLHRSGRGQRSARCGDPPPPALRRAVEQFNRGEFFQQHETLELEWLQERDPVRYLYQGILQIGIGFEHLRRGNPRGAQRLWQRGISYLGPFKLGCMAVDVDRLVADTERCLAELERVGAGGLERFNRSLIPRLEWLAERDEREPDPCFTSRDAGSRAVQTSRDGLDDYSTPGLAPQRRADAG
ncbi:MAG: DUF309 domain-containing protein [Solirubrobacteraceae bacterium]|jgi:predicted metal-dependent hydrolase